MDNRKSSSYLELAHGEILLMNPSYIEKYCQSGIRTNRLGLPSFIFKLHYQYLDYKSDQNFQSVLSIKLCCWHLSRQ